MFKKSCLILMTCMSFNFCNGMTQFIGTPPKIVSLLGGKFLFSLISVGRVLQDLRAEGLSAETCEFFFSANGHLRSDSLGSLDLIYKLESENAIFASVHDLVFLKVKVEALPDDKISISSPSCCFIYCYTQQQLPIFKWGFGGVQDITIDNFTGYYKSNISKLITDYLGTLFCNCMTLFYLLNDRNFQHPLNANILKEFAKSGTLIPVLIPECLHCLDFRMLQASGLEDKNFPREGLFKCPVCFKESGWIGARCEQGCSVWRDWILQHKIPTPIGLLNQQ